MRRVTTIMSAALLAVALMAAPALAGGPKGYEAPADGQCVSQGVQALGGKGARVMNAAATGGVVEGVNAVPIAILDHAFNNADGLAGLGLDFCD